MKMKAVIATDSISLRSRKMLLTFECPQDILINRSRPVHEATGGHAVRGNHSIHNHVWGDFADNQSLYSFDCPALGIPVRRLENRASGDNAIGSGIEYGIGIGR